MPRPPLIHIPHCTLHLPIDHSPDISIRAYFNKDEGCWSKRMVCIHQDDQASKRLDLGLSGCHGASTRLLFVASLGPDWRILSQTHIKVELPAGMSDTHQPPIVLFGKRLPSNFTTFPSSHSCWQRCICEMCNPTSIPLISSCPGCLLHYKRDALQTSLLASAVARSKEGRRRKRPIQCMRFQKPM